jgi:hypothetical protein
MKPIQTELVMLVATRRSIYMSNPNEKHPDPKRDQKSGQTESKQKSEIRKGVEEDMPDNKPKGQEKTGYSGGT